MKEDNTFCRLRLGQSRTCSMRRWWNVCGRHIKLCEGVFTVRVRVPGVVVVGTLSRGGMLHPGVSLLKQYTVVVV